jgi:hypothetical protein
VLFPFIARPWESAGILGSITTNTISDQGVQPDYHWLSWDDYGAEADIEKAIDSIRNNPSDKNSQIILAGYSFGAATVTKVAQDVSTAKNYKFALAFTVDPVKYARFILPGYSGERYDASQYAYSWHNWFQQTDLFSLAPLVIGGVKGGGITGASNFQVTADDFNAASKMVLARGQQWARAFCHQIDMTGQLSVKPWSQQLNWMFGHTAILLYPWMLLDLHVQVGAVAAMVAAANRRDL